MSVTKIEISPKDSEHELEPIGTRPIVGDEVVAFGGPMDNRTIDRPYVVTRMSDTKAFTNREDEEARSEWGITEVEIRWTLVLFSKEFSDSRPGHNIYRVIQRITLTDQSG